MGEHDVTVGEVSRRQDGFERRLDGLSEKFVLRREYDIDQRNTSARLGENAVAIGKVDAKVEVVEKEQAAAEKERQNAAAARRWQLFMLFASPIAAALVTILIFQGQTS